MPPAFHPLLAAWFTRRYDTPSQVQRAAWPRIAAGENVLLLAPTGSGKTLAAFFYALNQLATAQWPAGETSVLYVSPLKALNNDIQRNLIQPLNELRTVFAQQRQPFPDIKVATRSGDTPAAERRRLLTHPPEILITTPESLNLMLSTRNGRAALRHVRTVILDEIHAIIDTKRGTHLITAVDRLVRHAGEFQRLTLSATLTSPNQVAAFVSGYRLHRDKDGPAYSRRSMAVVQTPSAHRYEIQVWPIPARSEDEAGLVSQLTELIQSHRSTLLFVNSRRRCESLAAAINAGQVEPLVYAHHGSLARDIRLAVEKRLKEGRLRGIVATSSLELGIDVGSIDAVVLIQCPPTVASALQRIGRSGHSVHRHSLGTLTPTHGHDLLDLTVLSRAVEAQDLEPHPPIHAPLDVLAQILISMTATETWGIDALYDWLRTSAPYHDLSRARFDLVLEMLAGRYASSRIRQLQPRLSVDRIDRTVVATRSARRALYMEGGTIPDRGYYQLREVQSRSRIGELDEEFVWENGAGSRFVFGNQRWQVERVTHNEVLVSRWRGSADVPFWKGDQLDRDFHLAERVASFLEQAERELSGESPPGRPLEDDRLTVKGTDQPDAGAIASRDAFVSRVHNEYRLTLEAAEQLTAYLMGQRQATRVSLPHRHHLLAEQIRSGPQGSPGHQVFVHAVWGRRVTRPWGLALSAAWRQRYGYEPEIYACNHGLGMVTREAVDPGELVELVTPGNLVELLRRSLEGSSFFAGIFRECAGRALLLGRQRHGQRMPLWLSRIRGTELLEAVSLFDDFPIQLEAWRTCLQDRFDTGSLTRMLDELADGTMQMSTCTTEHGSPFALTDAWRQVNEYMYRDERPRPRTTTGLRSSLLDEIVGTPGLRPRISPALARDFEAKAQRLAPEYAPESERELIDWVKERVLLPWPEWEALAQVYGPAANPADLLARLGDRLVSFHQHGTPLVCAREQEAAIRAVLYPAAGSETRASGAPGEGPAHSYAEPPHFGAATPAESPAVTAGVRPGSAGDAGVNGRASCAPATETASQEPAAAWLAQWLRAYGPREPEFAQKALALDPPLWHACLYELLRNQDVVLDRLLTGCGSQQVCDAENYAALLRLGRARRRLEVPARPLSELQLLMGTLHGLGRNSGCAPPAGTEEGELEAVIEQLAGLPAAVALWERDILPARLSRYRPDWLDQLLIAGELVWYGAPRRRVAMALQDQLDLLPPPASAGEPAGDLAAIRAGDTAEDGPRRSGLTPEERAAGAYRQSGLAAQSAAGEQDHPEASGDSAAAGSVQAAPALQELLIPGGARYDFAALLRATGMRPAELYTALWEAVWSGTVSNDTFVAVRMGLQDGFRRPGEASMSAPARHRERRSFPRHRRRAPPVPGSWYGRQVPEPWSDALEAAEIAKERVRLLLHRYGVLFRELLEREEPGLRWGAVFRSLRLMELAGEVLTGRFFAGVPGLQFATPAAARSLEQLPADAVYWLNAADPASLAGLGLPGISQTLPARRPGTHMVFHGSQLVLVSQRHGRELHFRVAASHPDAARYLSVVDHLLHRRVDPVVLLTVERINDAPAASSPYAELLRRHFTARTEAGQIVLLRDT